LLLEFLIYKVRQREHNFQEIKTKYETRILHSARLYFKKIKLKKKENSKMAARGRKQKACLLKQSLGETLEIHLTGKTTEKRQNFDPSRPPACT
jgi:hypothetical protein